MLSSDIRKTRRDPRLPLWLVCWCGLLLVLGFTGRELFRTAVFAEGDIAANELNVTRAKGFGELHGNYSRFAFNHPGPAFFYVYAAGEWVLFDTLHVVPERYNAHLLTGAALQSLFLAGTLALLAGATNRRWNALALLAGAALLHLAFVPNAFFTIWPPHVLLLPFLCFTVAAAFISLGRWQVLPWFILSGGFLVHGHVAQPLFVFGLGGIALVLALRVRRSSPPPQPGRLRWVALLAAVFALPLIVDLFDGRRSNASRILLHFLDYPGGDRPGWLAALGSTLSYFGYTDQQETWFGAAATGTWSQFLKGQGLALAVSAGVAASSAVSLWILRHRQTAAATTGRRVAAFLAAALLLAILWARRQDTGITSYNSHFVFGLVFLASVPALFALTEPPAKVARCCAALILVGIGVLGLRTRFDPGQGNFRARQIDENLTRILAADPRPGTVKGLTYDWDNWYDTVTLAAGLRRRGLDFRILPSWTTMFGREHVLDSREGLAQSGAIDWWRIGRASEPRPGDIPIGPESVLRRDPPPPLPAWPARIEFSAAGNSRAFHGFGLSGPDGQGVVATEASIVTLRFAAVPVDREVNLEIDTAAIRISSRDPGLRRVLFHLNHQSIGEITVRPERATQTLSVPADIWNRAASNAAGVELLLEIPDSAVPSEVRRSRDHRRLGIYLHSIEFR